MDNCSSGDVYRKLMLLMMRSKRHMTEIVEKKQMTPVQGMLLMAFEPGKGRSMQQLSCMMGCDASNTTGLVDRLDSQDLIERTVDPQDRRVKLIQLNEKGVQCRNDLLEGLRAAEAVDMKKLTVAEQETFAELINKLIAKE